MATVLVAEDDLAIRDLVTYLLDSSGHQAIACPDGATALDAARRDHPDLAILDVGMPGMNGLDVCRALRAAQDTELMPVLMLTSHGQWIDVTTGFDSGADDYLVKPFSPQELLERVEALLEHDDAAAPPPASRSESG